MARKKSTTRKSLSKPKPRGKRRGRRKKPQELKLNLSPKVLKSIGALIFYFTAAIVILSFSRQNPFLDAIFRMLVAFLGWGVIYLPLIFISSGSMLIKPNWRVGKPTLLFGTIILFLSSISISRSGSVGQEFWASLSALITGLGSALFFFSGLVAGIMVIFEISLGEILSFIGSILSAIGRLFVREETDEEFENIFDKKRDELDESEAIDWEKKLEAKKTSPGHEATEPDQTEVKPDNFQKDLNASGEEIASGMINTEESERPWQFPPISILAPIKGGDADRGDVRANAQKIEDTLESFGIKAKVVDVNPGPAVTQYAIRLAIGTKLTKITSLSNDLALALAAKTGQIRIEAPIPGQSLVGIELPNLDASVVPFRNLLKSPEMKRSDKKLLIGLGLGVSGKPMVVDIARMPHSLIAGATGSGKSVCINIILMSILYRTSPSEVKLILVDPKRVELSAYNGIPHLLTPVIVDPEQVLSALKWIVVEMENRYKLLAEAGVRDIVGYNEMAGFIAMPYIVVVIDELADIMLFAPSEVEDCVTKIAQKARAAGIHLVLATQRPSVDVITGLIKANVPTRIAFNVSSMMDSRVILDMPGAEKLLGKGDMLYIPPDQAKPVRIQGAYISDSDIKAATQFLKNNGTPVQYTEEVTTKYKGSVMKGGAISTDDNVDDLFDESIKIVCEHDKASASLLQRRLSIGYNRAARILDQLQGAGIISAAQGSKPRDVLIKSFNEYQASQNQDSAN
jgi:S-DNA-T family DNA segregation ATPase FtsK/SpoIIIE